MFICLATVSICPTLLPQCLAVSPQFPLHLVASVDARVNPFVQRNDLRLSRQRLQLFLKTKNTIAPEKTSVDKHIKWKGRTVYDKRKLIFSQTHSDSATDHVHQKTSEMKMTKASKIFHDRKNQFPIFNHQTVSIRSASCRIETSSILLPTLIATALELFMVGPGRIKSQTV